MPRRQSGLAHNKDALLSAAKEATPDRQVAVIQVRALAKAEPPKAVPHPPPRGYAGWGEWIAAFPTAWEYSGYEKPASTAGMNSKGNASRSVDEQVAQCRLVGVENSGVGGRYL